MKRPPERGPMLTNCPVAQTTRTTAPVLSLRVSLVQRPEEAASGAEAGAAQSAPERKQMLTVTLRVFTPAALEKPAARAASRHVAPTIVRRNLLAADPSPLRS